MSATPIPKAKRLLKVLDIPERSMLHKENDNETWGAQDTKYN